MATTTCPYCQSNIDSDNPVLLAPEIEKALNGKWPQFEHGYRGQGDFPVGKKFQIIGVGEAEVVAKKLYDGPPGWSEDELPQGTEFDTYVVLKVGDGFYRKDGTGDSYNSITWAGPCYPVQAKEKTVTVYEF